MKIKNFIISSKRAQVTLFVIIGLVVLSISAVIISVNRASVDAQINSDFSLSTIGGGATDVKTIKQYFESVARMSSLIALEELGNNGGIIYSVSDFNYSKLNVKYSSLNHSNSSVLFHVLDYTNNTNFNNSWNVESYPCFRTNLPMSCSFPTGERTNPYYGVLNYNDVFLDSGLSGNDIKILLSKHIRDVISSSIDWNFTNMSYVIVHKENISVSVDFISAISNNVDVSYTSVKVNYQIKLIDRATNNEFDIRDFEIRLPLKFSSMDKMAKKIAFSEAIYLDYNAKTDYLRDNYAGFSFNAIDDVNEHGDAIYEITDETFNFMDRKNFTYRFAIRNRPPVLKYIPYTYSSDQFFYVEVGQIFNLSTFAKDPDDEDFWYEIVNVVPKYSTPVSSLNLFKERAIFDSFGNLTLNTSNMTGIYDFTVRATDGRDADFQNLTLVINDIPKVNFSMENGYYWHETLEVNPSSSYKYFFDNNFAPVVSPPIVLEDGVYVQNPRMKMLYVPCNDLTQKNIISKEEYIKLNGSYDDIFSKGGYEYHWSYHCNDGTSYTEVQRNLTECDGKLTCYAKPYCAGYRYVEITLEVFDGISKGTTARNYSYHHCLTCRPCCIF
jgi:hypothetical protein